MSQKHRGKGGRLLVVALALTQFLATATGVYATEPVGVVTEIDVRVGLAEVRRSGLQEWRPAGPLLALNAGDTVRVSQGASVVILLSGGRGSLKVDASNSPFQIPAVLPTAERSKLRRGWVLMEESFKALVKAANDSAQVILGTRGHVSSLTILTPRNGLVLPDSLVFEWTGSPASRYSIRIVGPAGLVRERKDIAGTRLAYPADALPPIPGMRYQLQLVGGPGLADKVWFEVVGPERAEAIRQDLAELVAATGSAVSPNTLVTTQVAYMASQGLLVDARLTLMRALANQPDDPTFHFLLGSLYERLGLPAEAAEAFAQARTPGLSLTLR
jgi:hypothetical protein